MKKIIFLVILSFSIGNIIAQQKMALAKSEIEIYEFQYNKDSDYFYCLPNDYGKVGNEAKRYPLVIYLHGGGGSGDISRLDYLGYTDDNNEKNQIAEKFQSKYPSFVFVPQSKRGWDGSKIIPLVEDFKSKYPIDNKRIYLIGYSMGGSGSYIFANDYYDYNQTLFAAIIRLAGQSQTILRDEISLKTSVWLHVGLNDVPKRINITREAYNFLKLKHPDVKESKEKININGITGTTLSLSDKKSENIKKTEYNGVGHGIYRFPFDDNNLLLWLFNQKLE